MARKSRKYISDPVCAGCGSAEGSVGRVSWRAALYARLSVEDERKKEHASLENQMELLRRYAKTQSNIVVAGEFADRGFSGTHFERPAFLRMLEEIEAGRINCVVVKDLSRFGRNHIQSGYYLEQLFPAKGVRFIALGESFDSLNRNMERMGVELPARNLINELYARDISRKVTARFAVQMRQGKFLGSLAPYGYQKSAQDRYRLEPKEEEALVVRRIFYERARGASLRAIAKNLDEQGFLPPGGRKGCRRQMCWHKSTVGRILKNPVYIGCTVQGKQKNIPLTKHRRALPPCEWVWVEGTHPALVEREIFHLVNREGEKNGTDPAHSDLHTDFPGGCAAGR